MEVSADISLGLRSQLALVGTSPRHSPISVAGSMHYPNWDWGSTSGPNHRQRCKVGMQDLGDSGLEAPMRIRDHQLDTAQAAAGEGAEKLSINTHRTGAPRA
jgi:hypothetical protein